MSLNPINTTPQNRVPQTPRPSSVSQTRLEESTPKRTREVNKHVNNLIKRINEIVGIKKLNRKQYQSRQP
tara:strand:- start:22 stop:231 length:210 start_codon:yes stop_codon:yes gene_type:complete